MSCPTPALPVIVPVFDRQALFEQTLRTILEHADGPVYPIVIDDMSGEDIEGAYNNIVGGKPGRYYRMARQAGPSVCRTFGASLIPGDHDYLYFSDADVYFEQGWDAKLVAAARAHPQFGIVSGLRFPSRPVMKTHNLKGQLLEQTSECGAVSMLIARSSWVAHGPFKMQKMYSPSEDIDLCERFDKAGLLIGSITPSVVIHTGMTSSFWTETARTETIFADKMARPEILFS